MLATEPITEPENNPATAKSPLEEHHANELMRHIPTIAWMGDKLDGDLRHRIEKLCAAIESKMNADAESELRALSRALDRLADAAKHIRNNGHGPNEPLHKVRWSINHALSCVRLVDDATFGRRAPFHHFEKSKSETLYAAFLVVLHNIERLTRVARSIDPAVTEQLCEGLVQLEEPLREQPMA